MLAPFEARMDEGSWAAARDGIRVFGARIAPMLQQRASFPWLCEEELRAMAAMGGQRRRAQFATGRWLLRYAAAQLLGPQRFSVRTAGVRPVLVAADHTPAAASISHSADLVLCAVGRVAMLGVDVEQVRPRRDWEGLSRHVLHPEERAGLEAAPSEIRWERLYRAWTCKEALAKALTVGALSLRFERILFRDGRLQEAPLASAHALEGWQLGAPVVDSGFAAAVVWRQ